MSLKPPDFYHLFAGDDAPFLAPRLPCENSSISSSTLSAEASSQSQYRMFGGAYQDPQSFVPSLANVGREQLYDEAIVTRDANGAKEELERYGNASIRRMNDTTVISLGSASTVPASP